MDALSALESGQDVTALVIGDVMLDAYMVGHVNRISPEAPVPVVDVQAKESRLGGAANVVKNLLAVGAKVHLATVIGNDAAGDTIASLLNGMRVGSSAVLRSDTRPTTVKTRVISNGQQLVRVDEEVTSDIAEALENQLIAECSALLDSVRPHVVIFEDYDKGVLTDRVIKSLIAAASSRGIKTTVDPKFAHFSSYRGVTLFKPNLKELGEGMAMAIEKTSDQSIERGVKRMHELISPMFSMVTLSERGVCIYGPDAQQGYCRIAAFEREIMDVSGAGDAVIAVASFLLALEVPMMDIAALSNLAGGLVCEKVGVVPIELERLKAEWVQHRESIAPAPLTR